MAENPFSTPATRQLDALGIPYRIFQHAGPLRSLEQAAAERGQRPEQVMRSIVFRLSAGEFVMALATGAGQLDWARLRAHLGRSRMSMASEAETLAVTGYRRGAVNPLGLPAAMRILVDRSVLRQEEISMGSGVPGAAVILRTADLLRALPTAEVGDFCLECASPSGSAP